MDVPYLLQLVTDYGCIAVFIGTFLEGETILLLAGILASKGLLSLEWVIISAFMGTLFGDQLFFFIGRQRGNRFLERRPAWNEKFEKVRIAIRRHFILMVLGFRFLYGLRTVSPFAFGMSRVSVLKFVILNVIGAAVWSVAVGVAGYLFGNAIIYLISEVAHYEIILGIIALAVASIVWGVAKFIVWRKNRATEDQISG